MINTNIRNIYTRVGGSKYPTYDALARVMLAILKYWHFEPQPLFTQHPLTQPCQAQ